MMGWGIRNNDSTQLWFDVFITIRCYMFIMRDDDDLFNDKLRETLGSFSTGTDGRKSKIRYTYEIISLIQDKMYDRQLYDLNYNSAGKFARHSSLF